MEAGQSGGFSPLAETHPSRAQLAARVVSLLSEVAKIPADRVVESATVDEDLRMESVVFVELLVLLEDEYQIEIDPIRVVELNEFGAIIDYLHETILGAQ